MGAAIQVKIDTWLSGNFDQTTKNEIKNWGLGVRAGMDTSWHFTRAFSIIGDLAFTGLWEQFKVTRFDVTDEGGDLSSLIDFKFTSNLFSIAIALSNASFSLLRLVP